MSEGLYCRIEAGINPGRVISTINPLQLLWDAVIMLLLLLASNIRPASFILLLLSPILLRYFSMYLHQQILMCTGCTVKSNSVRIPTVGLYTFIVNSSHLCTFTALVLIMFAIQFKF